MGLREWVILLALLFMGVLAADAWRRVQRQKRFRGRFTQPGRPPETGPESAVAARRVAAASNPVVPPRGATEGGADEEVPMLVESVEAPGGGESAEPPQRQYEIDLSENDAPGEAGADFELPLSPAEDQGAYVPSHTRATGRPEPRTESPRDWQAEPTAFEQELDARGPGPVSSHPDPDPEEEDVDDPALAAEEERRLADGEAADQLQAEPDEVLVVSVISREGAPFEGATLLQILLACGMRFGDMNIFHATDDQSRLQYSAANAYNPGTFDLDDIEQFSTRGVTFFLQLPCRARAMDAFDAMVQTATTLSTYLGGELLDESRSVMTSQTLTHYRERIRDYQRSQLVNRA